MHPRTPRRALRTSLPLAVGLTALSMALTMANASAAPARAGAAAASPAATAASTAVTDGSARFEVLSPTLIRLEYAGDNAFQDGATFNAVNRPAVAFTTDVSGGYREIITSALTLRYKENSGPFTAANTTVAVSGTNVTAAPAFPSYCAFGTACEAENGLLSYGAGSGVRPQRLQRLGLRGGLQPDAQRRPAGRLGRCRPRARTNSPCATPTPPAATARRPRAPCRPPSTARRDRP